MRIITHELGEIRVLERDDDPADALRLLAFRGPLAVDTETTGLGIYKSGFAVRLVQMGTADTAYVWQPQHFPELTRRAFTSRPWMGHNATYDMLAAERSLGIPFHESAAHAVDTGILSRLIDPRNKDKGGPGHALADVLVRYLGIDAKQAAQAELYEHGRTLGLTRDTVWREIPADDAVYLTYAGLDVLQTARVGQRLARAVQAAGLGWLSEWEHRLAYVLAHLTRRGMLLDVPYVEAARAEYMERFHAAERRLAEVHGITPTPSGRYSTANKAIIARLQEYGAEWTKRTPSGKALALDDEVLTFLINNAPEQAADLARTVAEAKRAHHYGEGYLSGFLAALGTDGRVHPTVNPMGASTGRMSIQDPPLQQIPTDDDQLRGALIADPGEVIISADYSAIEYRVAGAVTGDQAMIDTVKRGQDPHNTTARGLYGENFTKEQRTIGKRGLFGWIYGGGVATLAAQLGVTQQAAREMIDGFRRTYPKLARTRQALAEAVEQGNTAFRSPTGRRLISERGHAALNYMVQSPSRDIFADAVLKLADAGMTDCLRLVVHDEVVCSVPEADAEEALRTVQECMTTEFRGVPIEAEAEIKGRRWQK